MVKIEILEINEQLNKYNRAVEILKNSFKEGILERQIFNIEKLIRKILYKKYKEFYDEKNHFIIVKIPKKKVN
jgi:hypothetical protein